MITHSLAHTSMALSVPVFLLGTLLGLVLVGLVSSAKFEELFQPSWAMDHFIYEGELLKLKLDNYSGNDRVPPNKIGFSLSSLMGRLGWRCLLWNLSFLHILFIHRLSQPLFRLLSILVVCIECCLTCVPLSLLIFHVLLSLPLLFG